MGPMSRRKKKEVVILCEMPVATESELLRLRERLKQSTDRGFPKAAMKSFQRQSVRAIKESARKRGQNEDDTNFN